ncbi:MAG TPA: transketolase [Myxococcota bacterium]|nr:transketolase [Myxococcota bacterium]
MSTVLSPDLRSQIENTIRGLTIDAVEAAGIGHLGAPMGLARPAFQLWDRHLRFDPSDPAWPLRDRFVLSAGHASMLIYSLLHLFEYGLPLAEIQRFRQLHSKTPGHPEHGETPGVEVTTGPLGQGFGHAVGMALAGKLARSRFGRGGEGPGHHFVYVIASDGDLMEGVSYESASLAGHLKLDNLVVLYDDNKVTIDGPTSLTFSENVRARFEAQGWHVQEIDGEDVAGLDRALEAARAATGKPSIVVMKTTIGYGSPWAGQSKAHGGPFGAENVKATKQKLGIPEQPLFHVADEVRAYCKERAAAKRFERMLADEKLAAWRRANAEAAASWERVRNRALPPDLTEQLVAGLDAKSAATRAHSGTVIGRIAAAAPGLLIGGSADLAGSNNTNIPNGGMVGQGDDPFAGSVVSFGVREHAMGAITNGIALDGTFAPYCGTFLVFSDYMRPSVRLAALMKARSLFVFTHDSIFVGEDGPTHQPIEHVDALRAIPGLVVFRPADGVETALAWSYALKDARGPVAFALTRQAVPVLKRECAFDPRDVLRGAYKVRDPGGRPDVVLVATGSEVSVACDAATLLAESGIAARVVSAPSLELLREQGDAYVRSLLEPGVPAVAVEAGRGQALRALIGPSGLVIGMDGFGASASYQALAKHFGFVGDSVAARVRAFLGR